MSTTPAGAPRLYEYNPAGELVSKERVLTLTAADAISLTAPENGLVIAEVVE